MEEEIKIIDKYFRAANYLSACQLYLLDNPLLQRSLQLSDIKKKIVGHWGTVPGQNFIYTHLNRVIKKYNQKMIYISGPGHGGNFFVSQSYLEGTYTEKYPNITKDKEGLKKLFKQFSFPGGIGSHVAPDIPGSINEGGELGYSLSHAFGAVLDNPDLIAACIVGDGEAETGPLATSWHGNKFINPKNDGFVLPILHLNGYKISNPTVLSRMSNESLSHYFVGLGYKPIFVEGKDQLKMHEQMIKALDTCILTIKKIKEEYNKNENIKFYFPMIILRSPKGWTGPKIVNEKTIEGTFRAHQVPIAPTNEEELKILENWLRSYKPEELFDENGKIIEELEQYHPLGNKRMSDNPITNGGLIKKDLTLPDFKNYKVDFNNHGEVKNQDMLVLSTYINDIFKLNRDNKNFRVFCPDEAMSNRLYDIFKETKRNWQLDIIPDDEYLSKDGRIMDSYLSEHLCEGMLEGYLLSGRHGMFASYEAFIRVVDSMVSQHVKWLKLSKEISWRKPISSLNLILTSNVWQQDHNGYTHQDPGFLDHIANKKANVVRLYLPPDANCLLSIFDHCIKSEDYVNVIVASKHPTYQWLTMDEAVKHCEKGIDIWKWASSDEGNPDIVIATCGDTPTIEGLACVSILKQYLPNLKVRFINIVDLMKLQIPNKHPHALSDESYDLLFTKDKPILFIYHGYPSLIHELTYYRHNHNLYVAGYNEEGAITTSFDMRVRNKIDRFNLVCKVIEMVYHDTKNNELYNLMQQKLVDHQNYIKEYGIDLEEVENWKWTN